MNDREAPSARLTLPAAPRMDPFTERRIRTRVVSADPREPQLSRSRARFVSLAAVAVLASAGFALWMIHRGHSAAWLDVRPLAGALFREHDDGGVHVVDLTDGSAEIAVRSHPSGNHLVVRVPDGEIEDVGTRFGVTVVGGHTARIDVAEGRVIFRRTGQIAVVVEPGSSFVHEPEPAPPGIEVAPVAVPAPAEAAGGPVLPATCAPSAPAVESTRPAGPMDRRTSRERLASSTNPSAEAALEDDAYLHVLALLRAGDHGGAREAARAYLAHYPRGFRRAEMERVADEP